MPKRTRTSKQKPKPAKIRKVRLVRPAPKPEASESKTGACIALLSRPDGATIRELQDATGWQPHSVRGLLAGKIKKIPGVALTSIKSDGVRRYQVSKR